PFGKTSEIDNFEAVGCQAWPEASSSPTPANPLPNVPTLLLDGEADVRTPVDNAKAVAAQFPKATLVTVPGAGHSVLSQNTCAAFAMREFMADRPAGDECKNERGLPNLNLGA